MKRYRVGVHIEEKTDGEWVKAEEALAIEAERDALQRKLDTLKKLGVELCSVCNGAQHFEGEDCGWCDGEGYFVS